MPAQLVSLTDGPNILIDKPILLIGRHPECDIVIDSRKISRRHCCIAQINDYLVVRDLDSTNGIRVNGVRVLEGKILEGDEVLIGNSRFRLTWKLDQPPDPPAQGGIIGLDLEECEEPVPLADSTRKGVRTPVSPQPPRPAILSANELSEVEEPDPEPRS
jgi:hypothetical protein